MLAMLVHEALALPNGMVFDSRASCPSCGGPLSGYDIKERQFAKLIGDGGTRTIRVVVKRFRCRSCRKICNADEPFYPDTRIGAPVIDLCIAFSRAFGYGRAARNLAAMGVAIDRMQCRHFAQVPRPVPVIDMYGFPVPKSVLSLSALATGAPFEGGRIKGAEALAACGLPPADRAAPDRVIPGQERDEGDEHKRKKERDPGKPEDG